MKSIGVYIHVPFCVSKCLYCDFNSLAGMEKYTPDYFKAMSKEIDDCEAEAEVESIFIGGGTPSVVDNAYIGQILDKLSEKFRISENAEITIESNPGTLDSGKLNAYRQYGINRLSMGLQAADDRLLKILGRCHKFEDFLNNYDEAIRAGFKNINADLMFSLPDQSIEDWDKTLEEVTGLGLAHISCYSLIVEEGTPFYRMNEQGKINIPSEEIDREMYRHAKEFLRSKGYIHYEISNFARENHECRHNLIYWKAREYIGFGAGAHSYFNDYRFSNVIGIEDYITGVKKGNCRAVEKEYISVKDSMAEFMILGLRLIRGVDRKEFYDRYNVEVEDIYNDIIKKHVSQGLLHSGKSKIALTDKGLDLANIVMADFL